MTSDEGRRTDATKDRDEASDAGPDQSAPNKLSAAIASAKRASEQHVALAIPLRAAERNKRVAASVLAGGFAYRVFLWMLPFGLIVGGALGFLNAQSTENAVATGGLPAAIANAIGDASRSAGSSSWWLLAIGIPLLLWAGFSGAKAIQLIHALVWEEPPPKPKPLQDSLAFTGVACAFIAAVAATWWLRGELPGLFAPVLTFLPLAGLWLWVSLHLPHRNASWKELVPGALLVAIGFQVLHELVGRLLVPKLEKSVSLYGSLGATTTIIFFIYLCAVLVVNAPILNSSLYEELRRKRGDDESPSDG